MARLLGLAGAAVIVVALAGCGNEQAMNGNTEKSGAPTAARDDRIPDGAIAVGDDVYMVPMDKDAEGCTMFRTFSPTKAVTQAIQYRRADGTFTTDKGGAACT
jgi:hypothetical protein